MDCESVISLSSSSSRTSCDTSGESLHSALTVSSDTQRVPERGKRANAPKKIVDTINLESEPNHSEKVSKWIESCSVSSPDDDHSHKTTCIRYDFDKAPRVSTVPKSCFTRTTSLFSYMEEARKANLENEKGASHKLNGSSLSKTNLSPRNQKIALSSYLQLLKPSDKQNNFSLEDHRSGGAKMQLSEGREKTKELDGPLNVADSDNEVTLVSVNAPWKFSSEDSDIDDQVNKVSKSKRKKSSVSVQNKLLPLPPKRIYEQIIDFEDSVKEIVDGLKTRTVSVKSKYLKKVDKRRKFNFSLKLRRKLKKNGHHNPKPIDLRGKSHLKNTSLDKLVLQKTKLKKKTRRKLLFKLKEKKSQKNSTTPLTENHGSEMKTTTPAIECPECEIVLVNVNSDDENIDLKNFVDDMLELDKMSEEHRKSVIASRILASSSLTSLMNKCTTQEGDLQRAYKIFSDLSSERKNLDEKENTQKADNSEATENGNELNVSTHENDNANSAPSLVTDVIVSDHDYTVANPSHQDSDEDDEESVSAADSLSPVPIPDLEILPVSRNIQTKSLHTSLTSKRRKLFVNNYGLNWNSNLNSNSKSNHSVSISKKNGEVLRAFYQDYNLIITQENLVSVWTQSALGNVLGAQNMWIPKGEIQRITLNSTYTQKDAVEMAITSETSVAFVELWIKEHKSELRQLPVADVFATVYFWRLRQNGLEKKSLQLENIQGFADDVQYSVMKCYPKIIVSWHSSQGPHGTEKKTKIRSYHLAADFQTVARISEIRPVQHYVSSLHYIEDCDSLIMGCGENKITLWNVEYGSIVATIEMSNIKSPLSTLWVKCDRGYLFTLQECVDQELRLVAINGMSHSWKKLQNYTPPSGFDNLRGACIDNGILVAYYSQGILCWNAQTGDLIVEEVPNECEYIPCGKHVIMLNNENIIVRHSLSYFITDS